tara:strand:- start:5725 stop:5964 length:240 start_codon:yes stop_codon:yes gene_type:complete
MNLKKTQESLVNWGKKNYRTRSGKPSTQGKDATGEPYLPDKMHASVSPSKYAAATKKKRKSLAKGEASARHGLLKGKSA